jgi:superfamily II DNA or RNA helicase
MVERSVMKVEGLYHCELNGTYDKELRDKCIDTFVRSPKGIITSVFLFGEGVDFPCVDSICIAETMTSHTRIIQTLLRGNRLDTNNTNKINIIILPITGKIDPKANKVKSIINQLYEYDRNIFDNIVITSFTNEVTPIDQQVQRYVNSIKIDIIKNIRVKMVAFIDVLQLVGITNETQYYQYLCDTQSKELPQVIEFEYPEFTWDMVKTE